VTVATDIETAKLVHAGSIESMTFSGDDVLAFTERKDAILIGSGLTDDEASYARIRELVATIELPLVIDASALNAFTVRASELNPRHLPRVITPHPGELARILGTTAKDVNAHRIDAARDAARATGCIVVLKGFQSLIADPDGHVHVNPTGNPGMATGGMGDVLGGMIAALLARGIDPFDAAIAAVYIHGFAGDMLKDEMGDIGLAALDLAERIPFAIKRLRES
jgi:NAD(P)H-hydrate epimerase